jgi:uncharacterized protein
MSVSSGKASNPKTRVRRQPALGVYDRDTVYQILDEALIAHVAFAVDGSPFVIPMLVACRDDELLLHGSTASRLMRHLAGGADVCVGVTHLDGVVLARSLFNSSMNYRSVVVFGRARAMTRSEDKLEALRVFTDQQFPKRWDEARKPNDKELRATMILAVTIDEASAKVSAGPPQDEEADLELDIWAGEIPLRLEARAPVPDPLLKDLPVPESVHAFRKRFETDV